MKKLITALLWGCLTTGLHAQSIWNAEHLAEVKANIHQPYHASAFAALTEEADRLLNAVPLSVMMKEKTPASGNKHDYLSQARYFWPDPTKPDGLPYIERDGVSNPELEKLDRNRMGETAGRITTLALAWYFSGDEKYAKKATELIRVWFLNKDTRMNPNLEYAQMVPGQNGDKGRCYGVLDSYSFVEMLDAVSLLEASASFTDRDAKQLKHWFGKLLEWIRTSPQGIEESRQANNHSTAYDAQVIAFALYTGNQSVAAEIIRAVPQKRIFTQIEPDGKQPHELRRTLAFGYSQYNLTHLIDIFLMAQKLGIRLDNITSDDGRGFYQAMDFLAQYVGKEVSEWPFRQISGWDEKQQAFCKDLYRTARWLNPDRQDYLKLYREHRVLDMADRFNLLYFSPTLTDQAYAFAAGQLQVAIKLANQAKKEERHAARRQFSPRTLYSDGSLALVHPHDWCSGFFPGSLWQMYEYTHDDNWRQQAISFTWPIEEAKWHKGTHDLGFMMYDSFGKAYDLTGERSYKDVVLQSARTLITRYNPTVGCIRSWDHNAEVWKFPVIIDNLMNLEMLFRATQLTGDSIFWKVAVRHADTTLKNHFRGDYSSVHVVDYDPQSGEVRFRQTAQGNADDSFWSRGQAWGLYGYAMCYRFTHDPRYLSQSENIADFWLSLPHLPADGIPYWDMKLPETANCTPDNVNERIPRDASAAAIIASGLYELSTYVVPEKGKKYREAADHILESLHRYYQAAPGKDGGFLLLHSTGHHPGNSEIDVPLCYADYFYLEALKRKDKVNRTKQYF